MDSAQLAPTSLSSFRLLTFVRLSVFDRKGKISKGEEKKKDTVRSCSFQRWLLSEQGCLV